MKLGYVKNYRQIEEWKYYKKDGYAHLWQHLIRQAAHKDTCDAFGNKLSPGQFSTGRNRLATECGLSAAKVERILKVLENDHQIEQQTSTKCRVITILNWERYQQADSELDSKRTASEQQADNKRTQNKNDKNVKNVNKYIYGLLEFWNSKKIIHHKDTVKNLKKIEQGLKKRKDCKPEEIKQAIENYHKILTDTSYLWSHKWALWEFLKREKADKFYPEEFNTDRFAKNNVSQIRRINIGLIIGIASQGVTRIDDIPPDQKSKLSELDIEFIRSHGLSSLGRMSEYEIKKLTA